jgi:phage terminase small subunit
MPAHKKPVHAVQDRRAGRGRVVELAAEAAVVPGAPAGLGREAVETWHAFFLSDAARAVRVESDLPRLVRWIVAVDEWHRVSKTFRRKRLVAGSMGQPVLNPLAAYLRQLESTIAAAETEYGMTPLSRMKLGLTAAQGQLTAAQLNSMLRDTSEPVEVIEGWEPA